MNTKTKSSARKSLERLAGGPLTLGMALRATREGECLQQAEFARVLGISKSSLCDIEHGRKPVSAARAAEFARLLGYSEQQYVRLALQDELTRAGLRFEVELSELSPTRKGRANARRRASTTERKSAAAAARF